MFKKRFDSWHRGNKAPASKEDLASFAVHFDTRSFDDGVEKAFKGDAGLFSLLYRKLHVPKPYFDRLLALKFADWQHLMVHHASEPLPKSVLGLPMIDPRSQFIIVWHALIIFLDLTYTAFGVPLAAAFCVANNRYGNPADPCTRVELGFGAVYLLHFLLMFQTGACFICGIKRMDSLHGLRVARSYVMYGHFWLDLAAVIPFFYLIGLVAAGDTNQDWAVLITLLRMIRLLRFISLSRVIYLAASSQTLNSLFKNVLGGVVGTFVALLLYFFAVVTNLLGCMLLVAAFYDGPENSWLATITWLDAVNAPRAEQWYMGIYMCIITFTNTGSWSILPNSFRDMAVFNTIMIVGMVIYGIMLGIAIAMVTRADTETMGLYKLSIKMERVKRYIRLERLPRHLANQLQSYYRSVWWRHDRKPKVHSMRELPSNLRSAAVEGTLEPLLTDSRCGCFAGLDFSATRLVCAKMVALDVEPYYDLCAEGDEPTCLWVLEEGEVQVLNLRAEAVRTLTAPAVFGDAVLAADEVPACRDRLWGYLTLTPCRLWRLEHRDLAAASRVCADVGSAYLGHVQGTLMTMLSSPDSLPVGPAPLGRDGQWCELSARVGMIVAHMAPDLRDEALLQLHLAKTSDMTLQLLLDALLEISLLQVVRLEHCVAALSVCLSSRSVRATMEEVVERRSSAGVSVAGSDAGDGAGDEGETLPRLVRLFSGRGDATAEQHRARSASGRASDAGVGPLHAVHHWQQQEGLGLGLQPGQQGGMGAGLGGQGGQQQQRPLGRSSAEAAASRRLASWATMPAQGAGRSLRTQSVDLYRAVDAASAASTSGSSSRVQPLPAQMAGRRPLPAVSWRAQLLLPPVPEQGLQEEAGQADVSNKSSGPGGGRAASFTQERTTGGE